MKTIKHIIIIMTLLFATQIFVAQNVEVETETETETENEKAVKVKPFRIGTKSGFPNLIGGNIEYVTPILNNKVAVSVDYSRINSGWFIENNNEARSSEDVKFSYIEGGLNYYLFKPGKGLYAGLAYNSISFKGSLNYEDGSSDNIDETHDSFAIKLGAKLGGLFYFRPEIGYSFSALPTSYQVVSVSSTGESETYREDINREVVPEFLLKGLIANIGLGFAF